MSEIKAGVLADFQSITGIDNFAEAFSHLEEANWDLMVAIERVFPQEESPLKEPPVSDIKEEFMEPQEQLLAEPQESTPEKSTSNPADKVTSHSDQQPKKHRSASAILKAKYSKAKFILNKIAKNEAAGTSHEKDLEDKAKYQAFIVEYENRNTHLEDLKKQPQRTNKKRNRSQEETAHHVKKRKMATSSTSSSSKRPFTKPSFSENVRDQLELALVDEKSSSGKAIAAEWCSIEARLSEMVVDYILKSHGGPTPAFDSSEIVRGYRVIKCVDQFSKTFLSSCVAEISDAWEGFKLKVIPVKDIPRKPRARIWLPNMKIEGRKLLQCLQLQNPDIPMDDWTVIKAEIPQKNSTSFLLSINEESLPALEKADNKMRFGIRFAKLKIFQSTGQEDDSEETDAAGRCLEDLAFAIDNQTYSNNVQRRSD